MQTKRENASPANPIQCARREFCRHIMFGLVTSFAGGLPFSNLFVANVRADEQPGEFLLPLVDYPALANINGSVVFALPGAPNALAQIVVTRTATNQFYAVDSTCAHNQCQVPPAVFNPVSQQTEITCNCHGSRYKSNGELLGGPADHGLRAFSATLDGSGKLLISIPEFRFRAEVAAAAPVAGSRRIRITFPALAFLTYRVQFRPSITAAWSPVSFARVAGGLLNWTELQGVGNNEEIFLAVPGPAGFFSVVTD